VTFCPTPHAALPRTLLLSDNITLEGSKTVNKLSDSLMDLAGRVKRLQDSAAAVQEKNPAALQARRGKR
jgi:hypothetical protein